MNLAFTDKTGRQYPLAQGLVTIGSDRQNDIVVAEAQPAHASLLVEAEQVQVKFLVKKHGSRLNDRDFSGGVMVINDVLQIGTGVFTLKSRDQVRESSGLLSREFEGMLHALEELLDLRDATVVSGLLLKSSVSLLECSGGYLIGKGQGARKYEVMAQFPENDQMGFSTSAVDTAFQSTDPVQWFEGDTPDSLSESMIANKINAVLCGPLAAKEGSPTGALYIHRRGNRGQPFSESDLHLFGRLLRIFGLLIEDIRLIESQKKELDHLRSLQGTDLVYGCPAMSALMDKVKTVAPNDIPVLIQGETGTGKEVIARSLHNMSNRRGHPFVAVNCGAIPETLLESELFGHMKGSFTGAVADRKGFFEQANQGTLFLDEIGELPLQMQVALLRVLQEGKIRRVGGTEDIQTDVRLVFATNRVLSEEVEKGSFREDLFYRISVFCLDVPPLRERGRDVLLLANFFLSRFAEKLGKRNLKFSSEAQKAILSAGWKGNVRELENRVQRGILNAGSGNLTPADLELEEAAPLIALKDLKEKVEREAVGRALDTAKGNLTLAAQMLKIDRKVLRDIMKRLDIKKGQFKV